jgi:hypothetical protein
MINYKPEIHKGIEDPRQYGKMNLTADETFQMACSLKKRMKKKGLNFYILYKHVEI